MAATSIAQASTDPAYWVSGNFLPTPDFPPFLIGYKL